MAMPAIVNFTLTEKSPTRYQMLYLSWLILGYFIGVYRAKDAFEISAYPPFQISMFCENISR